jgi:transposase-like protein
MVRASSDAVPTLKHEINLVSLIEQFQSEDAARTFLEGLRWPDGARCLRCESDRISRIETRDLFRCLACNYQFSTTVGTIFHDSHLPLWKWFLATYLITESKKGMSANQIKRTIGVSYKTAWYLCHRIRAAMVDTERTPLTGSIEVDETYVGGKTYGMGRGYRGNKTTVLGAIQRGGKVYLKVAAGADKETLHAFIKEHAADDVEVIYTDEWAGYEGIADENTRHETVSHKAKEWVRGDAHTNTVENVWSLLDRSIIGAFHHVSPKHLDRYLDELEFRFNNRQNPYLFRDTMRALLATESLKYTELTKR